LRLFSFGGYGLALAALPLVVFGAYDSYPAIITKKLWIFVLDNGGMKLKPSHVLKYAAQSFELDQHPLDSGR